MLFSILPPPHTYPRGNISELGVLCLVVKKGMERKREDEEMDGGRDGGINGEWMEV